MGTTFDDLLKKLHQNEGASLSDTNKNGKPEQIIIVNDKRQFIIPEDYNTVLAYEGDVNSQIVTFQLPLFHESHNLSKCSHKVIRWKSLSTNIEDWSVLEEISIDDKEGTQTLKWTIPPAAFVQAGNIEIAISLYDFDNKQIAFSWNSASYRGFKVEKTLSNIDHQGVYTSYNIPSKNEILRIYEEGHNIVAPQDYNFKIGNYGNKNTSFVYFQAPKNIGGMNLLDTQTKIFVIYSIGGAIDTTEIIERDSSFAEGSPGEGLINFVWKVPDTVTCNTLKYVGPFSITVYFINGDKKWVTSDFNGLVLGNALLDEKQEVLNIEYLNILDGNLDEPNLTERRIAGLVQLRDSLNIEQNKSSIKNNELVIQANSSGECTDILIGQAKNNDITESIALSELIKNRLYIPDRKDIGSAKNLNKDLEKIYRQAYPEQEITYQEFLSTDETAKDKLDKSDLNLNANILLQNAGKYFGIMVPDLAPHLSAPTIITDVYFILETLEQDNDGFIQIFRGISNTTNEFTNNQLIEFQRSGQKNQTGINWSPWIELIDRGKPVATYVSTLYLGDAGTDLIPNLSSDYWGGKPNQDDISKINNSSLNFNTNSTLKKSGRYTGVMSASLASDLGAPPVAEATYFVLETIRYSPEKTADHWIIQIFTGINPPLANDKSGKIVEFKRTLYTTGGESYWTDWVETIDRGSTIAKRFSLKYIGAPGKELDDLKIDKPYAELIKENEQAKEIINRCNFNNLTEAGRYCGLVSPSVAQFINAPSVSQAQYFIVETKVYGRDNAEKTSVDWIIQTFSSISNPYSNEFSGEPYIYVRSMYTHESQHKWTEWHRVFAKFFEEVTTITAGLGFRYHNDLCQKHNFTGTLSVICKPSKTLYTNRGYYTIPEGSQGTFTVGKEEVSFSLVAPDGTVYSGRTKLEKGEITEITEKDVKFEKWDVVTYTNEIRNVSNFAGIDGIVATHARQGRTVMLGLQTQGKINDNIPASSLGTLIIGNQKAQIQFGTIIYKTTWASNWDYTTALSWTQS